VLPLDRLISHRLGLDDLDRAFELMRSGEALRVVLELAPDGAAA
jgi:Zn-dependent alcohol dehydrogenase